MERDEISVDRDYFDELLSRIKEIRASERRFYQKIEEIYSCSVDYDGRSPDTRQFFANVQNKFHCAVTGKTAAQLIIERANSNNENMGLKTWTNGPEGNIIKRDVIVAKNYLTEEEISELNGLTSSFLDYAETQTRKHEYIYMSNWAEKLDEFLVIYDYESIASSTMITRTEADNHAYAEYQKYIS